MYVCMYVVIGTEPFSRRCAACRTISVSKFQWFLLQIDRESSIYILNIILG